MRDYIAGAMRVFSNISPVIIFFIFTRILNVTELGLINYFISIITIVGVFTDFGIPEAIQRFLPQIKEKAQLITYTVKLEFLIVFLGAFLFLVLDIFTKEGVSKGYLLLLFAIFIFSASNTIILIFNGLDNKRKLSEYYGYSALLFLVITFGLYFILGISPVHSFLLGRLISWIIYTFIPLLHLRKHKLLVKEKLSFSTYTRFNKFALNTFVYVGSVALLMQWDSVLITNIDGAYTNGIYKSVAFIASIPMFLLTILHTKLLPFFSKLNGEKNFEELRVQLKKYVKYLAIILAPAFAIQFFIYEFILNLFLQREIVEQAGHLFPMIFFAICIHILSTPYIAILQAIGEEKFIRNLVIAQVALFITTSTILYPYYSYNILPVLLVLINAIFFTTLAIFSHKKINLLLN
jgi:O-antigen/teichoic acid export membrane protein